MLSSNFYNSARDTAISNEQIRGSGDSTGKSTAMDATQSKDAGYITVVLSLIHI